MKEVTFMDPMIFFLGVTSIIAIIVGVGFYIHDLKYKSRMEKK